jgi:hypothetical protein
MNDAEATLILGVKEDGQLGNIEIRMKSDFVIKLHETTWNYSKLAGSEQTILTVAILPFPEVFFSLTVLRLARRVRVNTQSASLPQPLLFVTGSFGKIPEVVYSCWCSS